jgi:hypothetical protein
MTSSMLYFEVGIFNSESVWKGHIPYEKTFFSLFFWLLIARCDLIWHLPRGVMCTWNTVLRIISYFLQENESTEYRGLTSLSSMPTYYGVIERGIGNFYLHRLSSHVLVCNLVHPNLQ